MIAGRGLQGLGMGVVPVGISLLRDVLPPERLGGSIALMSASMGVGGALGPPFAADGALAEAPRRGRPAPPEPGPPAAERYGYEAGGPAPVPLTPFRPPPA